LATPSTPHRDTFRELRAFFVPDREFRGLGLGYELLRTILGELRGRRVNAVETFTRRGSAENPSGPLGFYVRHGFRIFKDDREFPLVRLALAD
jgi:GNAT superfamily N-acetyltransferase